MQSYCFNVLANFVFNVEFIAVKSRQCFPGHLIKVPHEVIHASEVRLEDSIWSVGDGNLNK